MDPVITKILENVPYAGMGSTLERNALIGVIRNLIKDNKFTADYILNYCESVGYERQMAEDVFKELTGLSPALIVNNNEYYEMPSFVPNMCIAWGLSKSNKEKAFYIVPFSYGYAVMEKDEVNAPVSTVICATIPEAFAELKKVAKNIQTLDKIITEKLLEAEDVPTTADNTHQVNLPYSVSPLQVLKKSFKNKVLSGEEFERQAKQLLASDEITVDEAEDLMNWKQELIDEDDSYANETLQIDENWKPVEATVTFEDVMVELQAMADEDKDDTEFEAKAKELFEANPDLFKRVDILEAAARLYQLLLGFSKEEILGKSNVEKKMNKKSAIEYKEITQDEWNDKKKHGYTLIDNGIKYILTGDERGTVLQPVKIIKSSKKVTAENITLEDIEAEDNKDQVQEEIEKIEETPAEDIFSETTPEQYFDDALKEDKVDTINEVVSKCIDKFAEKFKDFDKYEVKILSYNTKVLGDYDSNTEEMVEDEEINANAILQVILQITNNADETSSKKVLAVFSITNGELHWTGTVRGENNQIVAFTEEGLDALFEVGEPSEDELEDII